MSIELATELSFAEYQRLAFRTAKLFNDLPLDLTHAALGMCTESGEFTSDVKRVLIYGKAVTMEMREHLCEELGDQLWYIALAASHLGVSLEELAGKNIQKLRMRYPDKYSDEAAEARADKGGLSAKES